MKRGVARGGEATVGEGVQAVMRLTALMLGFMGKSLSVPRPYNIGIASVRIQAFGLLTARAVGKVKRG